MPDTPNFADRSLFFFMRTVVFNTVSFFRTYSVQFDLRGNIEVDLYVSYDWKGEESYEALYDELLKQRTSENLTWFCPCAALRQKEFIDEQPAQVSSPPSLPRKVFRCIWSLRSKRNSAVLSLSNIADQPITFQVLSFSCFRSRLVFG